jgi:hypothetical protein
MNYQNPINLNEEIDRLNDIQPEKYPTNFSETRNESINLRINPEVLTSEVKDLIVQTDDSACSKGLFTVKTANKWIEQAKTRVIPKMLFGEFWFEGELCILFADTNLGKSILAVQIGNSISNGIGIQGFLFEANGQLVLYFDFELSDKQFENRYSINYQEHYIFHDNFIRVEINPDAIIPDYQSFEDYLYTSLELSIK